MNFKQLQYFREVAETEHMTNAAEKLHIPQPYLSKTIGELEDELGVQLFDRVGTGISLNPFGRILYQHCNRLFMVLEDAEREIKSLAKHEEKNIRIMTNSSMYIIEHIAEFHRNYPDIHFYQASANRSRILQTLRNGQINFGICTPIIDDEPDLETVVLIEEEFCIAHHEDHWLKDYECIDLKALKDEAFVAAGRGFGLGDMVYEFFKEADLKPHVVIESTETSLVPEYIKEGLGIGFIPMSRIHLDPQLKNNYVRITSPKCTGRIGLTYKRKSYMSPVENVFKYFTIQYYDEIKTFLHRHHLDNYETICRLGQR